MSVCRTLLIQRTRADHDTQIHSPDLLNSHLPPTSHLQLISLHHLLRRLFTTGDPSSPSTISSIRQLFAAFSGHDHLQVLQEAVVDVLESLEEEEADRKEWEKEKEKEGGMVVDAAASTPAEEGESRYLTITKALLVSPTLHSHTTPIPAPTRA